MFRTSYVHLQEDYIVHAALYGMLFMHLCKLASGLEDVLDLSCIYGNSPAGWRMCWICHVFMVRVQVGGCAGFVMHLWKQSSRLEDVLDLSCI
jgi:hypothetical protein